MKDWFALQMWPKYPRASFYDRLTILLKPNVSVCVYVHCLFTPLTLKLKWKGSLLHTESS